MLLLVRQCGAFLIVSNPACTYIPDAMQKIIWDPPPSLGAENMGLLLFLGLVGLVSLIVWRRYFSPISDVPGPFVASFTRLWHMQRILKGDQNLELIRLHEENGT